MKRMSLNKNGSSRVFPVWRFVRVHVPLMNAMPVAPKKLKTEDGSSSGAVKGGPRA
jgi:hypothetical protein